MKYACKVDLPNAAKETIFAGAKMATYLSNFFMHKAINRDHIISCLPKKLQQQKLGVHVTNIIFDENHDNVWVHKHVKDKCVLNIYLKAGGEETIFYEGDEVEVPSEHGGSRLFKLLSFDTLRKAESFVAKENECWVLKTSQHHSVLSSSKDVTRTLLQVYFFEDEYENIIKEFGEKNVNH
jgi:hypothetical protein